MAIVAETQICIPFWAINVLIHLTLIELYKLKYISRSFAATSKNLNPLSRHGAIITKLSSPRYPLADDLCSTLILGCHDYNRGEIGFNGEKDKSYKSVVGTICCKEYS